MIGVVACALTVLNGSSDAAWGEPELVGPGVVSTKETEFNTTFSSNGKLLVLTRYDDASGNGTIEALRFTGDSWERAERNSAGWPGVWLEGIDAGDGHLSASGERFVFYRDADIWLTDRNAEDEWSEPTRVDEISTASPEAYPTLSDDGSLCFTRQVEGNWDIFLARPEGVGWAASERLGAPVNTRYREHDALLTPQGDRLIFVRIGDPQGPGSSDLYTSVRTEDGWSEPELLPFNSPQIDGSPCLSRDGLWLYFTSGRHPKNTEAAGLCIWRVRVPSEWVQEIR